MQTSVGRQVRYDALLQVLRTADSVWNASRAFFDQWDLSPSQFNVLNLLREHPAGLSQTDLSRQLITHRSNVTGLVDRLEQRGLVTRREVAADRRAYRVALTRPGARLLEQVLAPYHQAADRVWEGVPDRRVSELIGDLQTTAANATRMAEALRPAPLPGTK